MSTSDNRESAKSAVTRRGFLATASVGATLAIAGSKASVRAHGANDVVRVGVVGLHQRGQSHVELVSSTPGLRLAALCDVDPAVLDRTVQKAQNRGNRVHAFKDVRDLIASKEIDAITIAMPNHWHALAAIWACQAGKDVYVEKPVSHNVFEGRQLVNAARRYGRVVQGGMQARSNPDLIDALGRDKLAQADRAVDESRFEDAVSLLNETIREFKGTDAAKSARNKLNILKKKKTQVVDLLRAQEDVNTAETMLASALEDIRDGDFGEGYDKLEQIVNDFGSTKTAEKAQTVLERMRKNEGVMAYVKDHKAMPDCNSWLSQARAYRRVGQSNKAKELYRRILEKYPDTVYADDAARELAELP